MTEKKWSVKRVHDEIYEARTKIFVTAKVLETGSVSFAEHPEWVLIVKQVLADLRQNVALIEELLAKDDPLQDDKE